jgi:polyprenyl P-hydroxybenzoate/phenylacrylic acid decarboxylase-like protein
LVLLVGMSGGSGVIYGVRLLEVLKRLKIETHLVISTAAKETLVLETNHKVAYVESLASRVYRFNDIAAAPASGTFRTEGMVVIPSSMKTLAGIASGYSDNLLLRAAEVTLKERRPLVLVPRETPLTTIHMENMLRVAQAGAIVLPAMPGFYNRPKTIDELVDHVVGKVLDVMHIEHDLYGRWSGPKKQKHNRVRE